MFQNLMVIILIYKIQTKLVFKDKKLQPIVRGEEFLPMATIVAKIAARIPTYLPYE